MKLDITNIAIIILGVFFGFLIHLGFYGFAAAYSFIFIVIYIRNNIAFAIGFIMALIKNEIDG